MSDTRLLTVTERTTVYVSPRGAPLKHKRITGGEPSATRLTQYRVEHTQVRKVSGGRCK